MPAITTNFVDVLILVTATEAQLTVRCPQADFRVEQANTAYNVADFQPAQTVAALRAFTEQVLDELGINRFSVMRNRERFLYGLTLADYEQIPLALRQAFEQLLLQATQPRISQLTINGIRIR